MLLSCQNIHKSYPQQTLFSGASFLLNEGEKAAIVGNNGTGKTTLLKILIGEESPDEGQITIAKDATVGYLAQENDADLSLSIYELMLSARPDVVSLEHEIEALSEKIHTLQQDSLSGACASDEKLHSLALMLADKQAAFEQMDGYSYKSLLTGMLKGLGFSEAEFDKPFSTLSGGQKTRANLARLLFQSPDLIILDEPTNHLDIRSLQWLEGFLKGYKGAVLLVSHDRYFLDHVVDRIIAIEEHKLHLYRGNYSAYATKSAALYEARLAAYYKQEAEIAHQEAVIAKLKSFNREKSIKRAESREKKLEKIQRLEKPENSREQMHLSLDPNVESGKDVLTVSELSKGFNGRTLFTDTSFMIRRGEHVAIIGENGTGKTTLLKLLTGLETPDSGEISYGAKVQVGYYDQEHQELESSNTLFDEISDAYPTLDNTKIRNTLAAFLFTGEDVYKQVASLSGGEKGRLSLAKLMLSGANFLILDEPTNHLDIASKEILEEAINDYTGTLLYVSHDRYFVNRTATRILDLTAQHFYEFNGNYDYYLEKKDIVEGSQMQTLQPSESVPSESKTGGGREEWEKNKAEQARLRRRQQALEKCENEIASLEEDLSKIKEQLSDPKNGTNLPLLSDLTWQQSALSQQLEKLYETWEELSCEED